MIFPKQESKPVNMLPGLTRRTLAQTQNLMVCEFTFEGGVTIPIHSHPHEQVGYLVSGHMVMTIDGKKYELYKGDSYCAPSNIPHGAFSLEPSVIVDTFNPPREDYR